MRSAVRAIAIPPLEVPTHHLAQILPAQHLNHFHSLAFDSDAQVGTSRALTKTLQARDIDLMVLGAQLRGHHFPNLRPLISAMQKDKTRYSDHSSKVTSTPQSRSTCTMVQRPHLSA